MDVMIEIISLRLRLAIASSDRVPLWPFPSRQYMPTRPGWSRWRHTSNCCCRTNAKSELFIP